MIDQVVRLLGYDFVQNAIAAGIVIAVVSGVVSRFVVARNMSFAVHALAELGFTGAAGAILIGISPVLGLLDGNHDHRAVHRDAWGSAPRARRRCRRRHGLRPGAGRAVPDALSALRDRGVRDPVRNDHRREQRRRAPAARDRRRDPRRSRFVYRPLTFATVDPEVAEARGVPVRRLAVVFLLIMAAAVAEAVQIVGVLLILTLLITPGAAAERLTARPGRATAYSVGIALFCVLGGIFLALASNVPVSVFVTSLSFASTSPPDSSSVRR